MFKNAVWKVPHPQASGGRIVVTGVTAANLVFESRRVVIPSESVPLSLARLKYQHEKTQKLLSITYHIICFNRIRNIKGREIWQGGCDQVFSAARWTN